jgi:hypothetical protein
MPHADICRKNATRIRRLILVQADSALDEKSAFIYIYI